jgi:hypothetical protein
MSKFNLHIIGRVKKGCEFNQKRYEFKILLDKFLKNLTFLKPDKVLYFWNIWGEGGGGGAKGVA